MPKTNTAAFPQDPKTFGDVLKTAVPGTGVGSTLLFTAGAEGAVVSRLSATPIGTATATGVTVYVEKAGTTVKLPKFSVTVPAYTLSAAAKLPTLNFDEVGEITPMRMGAGDKLYAAIHVAQTAGVVVVGEAVDY